MKLFSTFSGIGGFEKGIIDAGFDLEIVGHSEIKKFAEKIYDKHFPNVKNYGDITKIDFSNLPDFELLTGGFPCQSFSSQGERKGIKDSKGEKGMMFFYLYKLLKVKKPKWFLFENVKGILTIDKGRTIKQISDLFHQAGYRMFYILLDSQNFGSAQRRQRVYFFGSLDGSFDLNDFKKYPKKYFKDVRDIKSEYKYFPKTKACVKKILGKKEFKMRFVRDNEIVGTLDSGCKTLPVIEKNWVRYLTPIEAERLQGFPDNWTEGISENQRINVLGNAVNVDVIREIFKNIKNEK